MKENSYCEVFGSLEKMEEFTTIHNNIVPGSLVFESLSPFWGYYSDDVQDSSPVYIYFAVDKLYPVFDVVRAFRKVSDETGFDFDAAKAFINFNDRSYNVIRLRHFSGFEKIRIIQEAFVKNGIKLHMSHGSWNSITVHIALNKVFCMKQLTDGITLDASEKNHAYIEIPRQMDFNEFVEVTEKVRHNWFESKFDAALGYYLLEDKVADFIRNYSKDQELGFLSEIRKLYLLKMK
jgi:hypothetical protein